MPEPPPSPLRRLLQEHPRERQRLAGAVASLLGAGLVALVAFGFLIVWHLVRRGRLIREGLSPPRKVRLPEVEPSRTKTRTELATEPDLEPAPGLETTAMEMECEGGDEQGPRPT